MRLFHGGIMRSNSTTFGIVGVALAALMGTAGCGGTAPEGGTAPSVFSASTVAALASPEVPIFNVDAAGLSADGRGPCVFDGGTGRFGCDDRRHGNLTFSRTVTFYDASGVVQPAYDATTTASIKTETSVSGSMQTRDGGTATISRTGLMTVSGLEGAETTRTLNGSEQGTVALTGTGPAGVSFNITTAINDTTVNLVVPVPTHRMDRRGYPLSGVRTHGTTTTTTRGSETRTDTGLRKETFDGTAIVQIELTINGVTENCSLNLETHRSTCHR
jgi:hypothetical protein